jgi:erythritol transport system permease protein
MNAVAYILSSRHRMASSSARLLLIVLRARALLVLVALVIVFSVLSPDFLTANNLSILSKHIAVFAMLAVGMTFVVLTGGIDLSVGSIVGLSGIVAGYVLTQGYSSHAAGHFPVIAEAVIAALLVSLLAGAINGWLVSKVGVAPFIATLGMLYIARGAALLCSNGKTFPGLGGQATHGHAAFAGLGQSFLFHVPVPVLIALLLFLGAAIVAAKTPFGRHVYAVGGNDRASRLSGIRVARVKFLAYLFSAVCAGLVGLIIASELEAAHPATGETFELNAIAAIVLGGTSLMGGRGSVSGSLLGACVIGVLSDGLVMLGVSEFWQIVVKGLVIVLAVSVDQLQVRLQARLLPYLLRSRADA